MRLPAGLSRPARFILAAAFLVLSAQPSASEIYQWVDDQGTIHFTDELSSVPPDSRGKTHLLLREAPSSLEAPPAGAYAPPTAPEVEPGAALPEELDDVGDPATQAELLRAKIAAKEQLIESVDKKRSLATNPLRNRFVSPSDMELYRKYQAELPGDRERLKELESQVDSLNR